MYCCGEACLRVDYCGEGCLKLDRDDETFLRLEVWCNMFEGGLLV